MDETSPTMGQIYKQEVLVVLMNTGGPSTSPLISNTYKIRQAISPRVFTVECAGDELAALHKMPGISVVSNDNPLPDYIDDLSESEKLFVSAWMSRQQEQGTKQRPGDGLSWDAPGFTAPGTPEK